MTGGEWAAFGTLGTGILGGLAKAIMGIGELKSICGTVKQELDEHTKLDENRLAHLHNRIDNLASLMGGATKKGI